MYKVKKYAIIDGVYPGGRGGSSLIEFHNKVILFGGHYLHEGGKYMYLNEVWIFEAKTGLWKSKKCLGTYPKARYGHNCHLFDDKMVIFGGKGPDGSCLNDICILDISTWTWLDIPVTKDTILPKSRMFAASTILSSTEFLIHGGWNSADVTYMDMWIYNITTYTWNKVKVIPSSHTPSAKYGHSITLLSDGSLLLFGGCMLPDEGSLCPRYSNEVRVYDKEQNKWYLPKLRGYQPTGRYGHSALLYPLSTQRQSTALPENISKNGDKLLILGGWGKNGCQSSETINNPMASELLSLNLDTWEWTVIGQDLPFGYSHSTTEDSIGTAPSSYTYTSTFNHCVCMYPLYEHGRRTLPASSTDSADNDDDDDEVDDDEDDKPIDTTKKQTKSKLTATNPLTKSQKFGNTGVGGSIIKSYPLTLEETQCSILLFGGYDGRQASKNMLRFEFHIT